MIFLFQPLREADCKTDDPDHTYRRVSAKDLFSFHFIQKSIFANFYREDVDYVIFCDDLFWAPHLNLLKLVEIYALWRKISIWKEKKNILRLAYLCGKKNSRTYLLTRYNFWLFLGGGTFTIEIMEFCNLLCLTDFSSSIHINLYCQAHGQQFFTPF